MLKYVSSEKYEAEKALRIQAEARATELERQNTQLWEMLKTEGKERGDILDRFLPKSMPTESNGKSSNFTSEQAWRMPAFGKTDMLRRNSDARRMEREEMSEEERAAWERRYSQLSEEERRDLSTSEDEALNDILRVYDPQEAIHE